MPAGGILLVGIVAVRVRGLVSIAVAILGSAVMASAFVAADSALGQVWPPEN